MKIGRKHSGAKSEKVKQKRRNAAKRLAEIMLAKKRKWDLVVREYFLGLRDELPRQK